MRNILLAIVLALLPASLTVAEQPSNQKPAKSSSSGRPHPVKGAAHSNPCAVYGPGFVRVEGSDTCVSIGGGISIGAGSSSSGWR
jgi:hypothetical protein